MSVQLEVTFRNLVIFEPKKNGSVLVWLPDYRTLPNGKPQPDDHRPQLILEADGTRISLERKKIILPSDGSASAVDLGERDQSGCSSGCPNGDDSFLWVFDLGKVESNAKMISKPEELCAACLELQGGQLRTKTFVEYENRLYKYSSTNVNSSQCYESALASTVIYRTTLRSSPVEIELKGLDGNGDFKLNVPASKDGLVQLMIDNEPYFPGQSCDSPKGKGKHFHLYGKLIDHLPSLQVDRGQPCCEAKGVVLLNPPFDVENCYLCRC